MKRSLIRNLLRAVDGLGVYLIGFLIALFSKRRQRLGDHVAGTCVVERAVGRPWRLALVVAWVAAIGAGIWGALVFHRAAPTEVVGVPPETAAGGGVPTTATPTPEPSVAPDPRQWRPEARRLRVPRELGGTAPTLRAVQAGRAPVPDLRGHRADHRHRGSFSRHVRRGGVRSERRPRPEVLPGPERHPRLREHGDDIGMVRHPALRPAWRGEDSRHCPRPGQEQRWRARGALGHRRPGSGDLDPARDPQPALLPLRGRSAPGSGGHLLRRDPLRGRGSRRRAVPRRRRGRGHRLRGLRPGREQGCLPTRAGSRPSRWRRRRPAAGGRRCCRPRAS